MEDAFFGELRLLAFNFTPEHCMKCDGQRISLSKMRNHVRAEPLLEILAARFGDPKDPESLILPKLELKDDNGKPLPFTLALNLRGPVVGPGGPMPNAINTLDEDALIGEIRLMPNYMLESRSWSSCDGARIDGGSTLASLIGYTFGEDNGSPRLPLLTKHIPDVRQEPFFKLNATLVPNMELVEVFKPRVIDGFKGNFKYAVCTEGMFPRRPY